MEHFAERLGVARPRVLLSDARTRWGSCNAGGEVRLNWRLMQAPEALIDYVVAHEVAHLLHLNHSPRFWRAVERIYPAWETARAELAATSHHYMSL
ncbi:MAG: M48 family metallopeptidase [Betaproteobacteria bacterium]